MTEEIDGISDEEKARLLKRGIDVTRGDVEKIPIKTITSEVTKDLQIAQDKKEKYQKYVESFNKELTELNKRVPEESALITKVSDLIMDFEIFEEDVSKIVHHAETEEQRYGGRDLPETVKIITYYKSVLTFRLEEAVSTWEVLLKRKNALVEGDVFRVEPVEQPQPESIENYLELLKDDHAKTIERIEDTLNKLEAKLNEGDPNDFSSIKSGLEVLAFFIKLCVETASGDAIDLAGGKEIPKLSTEVTQHQKKVRKIFNNRVKKLAESVKKAEEGLLNDDKNAVRTAIAYHDKKLAALKEAVEKDAPSLVASIIGLQTRAMEERELYARTPYRPLLLEEIERYILELSKFIGGVEAYESLLKRMDEKDKKDAESAKEYHDRQLQTLKEEIEQLDPEEDPTPIIDQINKLISIAEENRETYSTTDYRPLILEEIERYTTELSNLLASDKLKKQKPTADRIADQIDDILKRFQ